jgi:hypothetical protein
VLTPVQGGDVRRFVVRQDRIGGWDVHEVGSEEVLHRSDRIRAEHFARRLASTGGGAVLVVGHTGLVLTEYEVPVSTREPLRRVPDPPRQRRRGW